MPRKMREAAPHFSDETIFCLVVIPGETGDSGPKSSLNYEGKLAIISAKHERFSGESLDRVPDPRSGLIMGDFRKPGGFPPTTYATQGRVAQTPYFPKPFPVRHR